MTVHSDYLGTPREIKSGSSTVWKWENTDVFGGNLPSLQTIEYNLRFSGQYFDKENKLHYNINRTYNPKLGRYMQSDPLGLAPGFNTYQYVNMNPLNYVDPDGLNPVVIVIIGGIAGGLSNGLNYYSQGQSFKSGFINGAIIGGASSFITSATVAGIVAGAGTQLLNRTWDGVKIFDSGNPLTDCAKEIALTGTIGGVFGAAFDGLAQGIVGSSTNSILIKHIDIYRAAVTNAYVTSYTNIANAYANLGSVLK